tara:strand:- start:101 stop:736 length:636 start_codon:yes stop_codon:yes gene_type:complete
MGPFASAQNAENQIFGGAPTSNIGHRLGGTDPSSDNTIAALMRTINLVNEPNFKYWEFDVHESKDGVLFVFHDDVLDIDGKRIPVKELTFAEISSQGEMNGIEIPTMDAVVEILSKRTEPVMIEIKNLFSDAARRKIISVTAERSDWQLIASVKRFLISFPRKKRTYWHKQATAVGTSVYRIRRHEIDLFDSSRTMLNLFWNRLVWWLEKG